MPSEIKGIVLPHKKVSRLVSTEDLQRVYDDAEKMHTLCNRPIGIYRRFYAIAHPQCVEEDPLRFFVVNSNTTEFSDYRSIVIINPIIERHTNQEVDSEEGCASLSKLPTFKVKRWNKCEVAFTPLIFNKNNVPMFGSRTRLKLSGKIAKIWQHEINHLDGIYLTDLI